MPRIPEIRREDKKIKNVSNVCVVEHQWKVDILPRDQAWRNILKSSGDMPSGQQELRSSWNQSSQCLCLLLVQKTEHLMDSVDWRIVLDVICNPLYFEIGFIVCLIWGSGTLK